MTRTDTSSRRRFLGLTLTAFAGLASACTVGDDGTESGVTAFDVRIENVSRPYTLFQSGVYDTPVGAAEPGPLFPGDAFELDFIAPPGARLSFAMMFGQSNDLFYGPGDEGIALYDDAGTPLTGDVTDQVHLWDAGTEANQEPGLGADQAPRQAGPDTGAPDPDDSVRLAADEFDNLPAVADNVRATIESTGPGQFTLRVENVGTATILETSDGGAHPAPLSPGAFAVHTEPGALFTEGESAAGTGLERIAEDGSPAMLAEALAADTGLTVPVSPAVWAVHTDAAPLFAAGEADRGQGLERIAEDGSPDTLAEALAGAEGIVDSAVANTPVGADMPGPLFPGDAYEFSIEAAPGDRLSFAAMFGPSNDLFFAPGEDGIVLFMEDGSPIAGDVTADVAIWDLGTEANQPPGAGSDQAPFQAAPDTGADESGVVQTIAERADGFAYPSAGQVLRVTITPAS